MPTGYKILTKIASLGDVHSPSTDANSPRAEQELIFLELMSHTAGQKGGLLRLGSGGFKHGECGAVGPPGVTCYCNKGIIFFCIMQACCPRWPYSLRLAARRFQGEGSCLCSVTPGTREWDCFYSPLSTTGCFSTGLRCWVLTSATEPPRIFTQLFCSGRC